MQQKNRRDVPVEETWDLSLIYPNEQKMWEELEKTVEAVKTFTKTYSGNLKKAETIVKCLDDLSLINIAMYAISSYTALAVEVDYTDNAVRARDEKAGDTLRRMESELTFVDSEILAAPEEELAAAVEMATASRRYLKELHLWKKHRLSPETEQALAALSKSFGTPYTLYNTVKLADMSFPPFTVDGKEYPLGYSLYEDNYSYVADTNVRRAAFRAFSDTLKSYRHTTAAAYNACVSQEKAFAELRGFANVFDSLLYGQKVSRQMYDRQIDVITERLAPHMRKYARLLGKVHKLDKVTFADLKVPLDPEYTPSVTREEARGILTEGLSVLGEDYVAMVERAFAERWIDFAKNAGKATGGFCSSVYGKNSFILLNWNDRMSDVITLAHELGHAGQGMYTEREQSVYDAGFPSFFVEAPSTMNELLLANHLLSTKEDRRFRRFVLSCMVSNTYYHNFVTHLREAWYQREVYRLIDAGESVDADVLDGIFRKNLELFWGDAVEITEGAERTWMRQPHYYMGLYSYTYSAGLTLATQAMLRIKKEGWRAVADWKRFLAAGDTLPPLEMGKLAGIDMSTDGPLLATIDYIGSLIDEICRLTEEIEGD